MWHKGIRIVLFLEIIFDILAVVGYEFASENGHSILGVDRKCFVNFQIIMIVSLGATLLWDSLSNYTRKAEILDIVSMEYSIAEVEWNIENRSDDKVRLKLEELERRLAAVIKWAEGAVTWEDPDSIFRVKPSPPPPPESPKNEKSDP